MKVLSLFDGISDLQQVFKNLGIEFDGKDNIYLASEIDKHAISITQKNFPNTRQLGNVKNIKILNLFNRTTESGKHFICSSGIVGENFEQNIFEGRLNLLYFGSPCQDISIAKKNREGLKEERSGLFYEALRILKEAKPKFFIMENVASMSKEAKEEITKELFGIEFGIEPVLLNSALLTAQNRKRLFWCGRLKEDGTYEKMEYFL